MTCSAWISYLYGAWSDMSSEESPTATTRDMFIRLEHIGKVCRLKRNPTQRSGQTPPFLKKRLRPPVDFMYLKLIAGGLAGLSMYGGSN